MQNFLFCIIVLSVFFIGYLVMDNIGKFLGKNYRKTTVPGAVHPEDDEDQQDMDDDGSIL